MMRVTYQSLWNPPTADDVPARAATSRSPPVSGTATSTARAEIDFSVYDPKSMEFVRNPWPVWERMRDEFPLAFHTDLGVWMISPHDLALEVTRSPRFSTSFSDWEHAPAPKP